MLIRNCLVICSLLVCLAQIDCVLNPKVVCYYESWCKSYNYIVEEVI